MKNPSGWEPVEFNCVVRVDKIQEKTKGGIFLPDEAKEADKHSSTEAELIAVSPVAFTYETWPDDSAKPKAGDRILMAKYAGSMIKNDADTDYRIIKDKDILAVRVKA